MFDTLLVMHFAAVLLFLVDVGAIAWALVTLVSALWGAHRGRYRMFGE